MTNDVTRSLFLALVCVLVGLGVVMVHSASITSWPTEFERVYLSKHIVFLGLGCLAGFVAGQVPAATWRRLAPWLLLATLLLLAAVLVPGIGTRVKGARRWLRLAGFSMQPSELTKLTLPIYLAHVVARLRERGWLDHWLRGTIPVLLPIAATVPLVLVEPDLGNSIFLVLVAGITLWVAGWPLRNFVVAGGAVVPLAASLLVMRPYQVRRITGFLETWADIDRAPYQVKESLYTIGSGGYFGVGIGKGWQKLSFLPEANTDFVVAVIGEELGLVGTLGLLILWISVLVVGRRLVARTSPGSFTHVASSVLLLQLVLQAALNVAVVTAMVPPKGIPHPLVSYGGSNLVCCLVSIGIIAGLTTNRSGGLGEITDSVDAAASEDVPASHGAAA